jgi:hypothetical protein
MTVNSWTRIRIAVSDSAPSALAPAGWQPVRWVVMTRVLRGVAALLVSLLASVLFVVALVLCITLVLLPLGVPLLILSIWLFKKAAWLLLPRKKDIQRSARQALRIPEIRKAVQVGPRRARRTAGRLRKRSARLVARAR